jgi:hypothetical protein
LGYADAVPGMRASRKAVGTAIRAVLREVRLTLALLAGVGV